MIRYVVGPRASGVGLIKHILVRGGLEVRDIPGIKKDGWSPEPGCFYTGLAMSWLKDYVDESLVLLRCPLSCMLSIFNAESEKSGRTLIDEETFFHARIMTAQLMTINQLIVKHRVPHFIVKRDGSFSRKLPALVKLICGRNLVQPGDALAFLKASGPGKYDPTMISSATMREIHRAGGFYGRFGIDLEVNR